MPPYTIVLSVHFHTLHHPIQHNTIITSIHTLSKIIDSERKKREKKGKTSCEVVDSRIVGLSHCRQCSQQLIRSSLPLSPPLSPSLHHCFSPKSHCLRDMQTKAEHGSGTRVKLRPPPPSPLLTPSCFSLFSFADRPSCKY